MTRALLFGTCAILLLARAGAAQTIHGMVLEDGTQAPVAGAYVELLGRDPAAAPGTYTDSLGSFVLTAREPGTYTIRVSHPSFLTVQSQRLVLHRDDLLGVELRMGRAAIPLQPLRVATRAEGRLAGFRERVENPGFGYFVTRADVEQRAGAARASDLLRELPGIEVVPVKRGGSSEDALQPLQQETVQTVYLIAMRGRTGNCQPAIFVDGMRVAQTAAGGVDDFLRPDMIEGVEIYTGSAGLPSGFVAPDNCGAVLFWSRTDVEPASGWKTRLLAAAGALIVLFGSALAW